MNRATNLKPPMDIGNIEFVKYKDSDSGPLSPEEAELEAKHQRSIYGSSIYQACPDGTKKLLVDGEWRVVR